MMRRRVHFMSTISVCTAYFLSSPMGSMRSQQQQQQRRYRPKAQRAAISLEEISAAIASHPFMTAWLVSTAVGSAVSFASERQRAPARRRDSQLPMMPSSELRRHDGKSLESIYLAADGLVFDVTTAKKLYGPGGDYAAMAGRDASRMLARGKLKKMNEDDEDTQKPLSLPQRAALKAWVKALESKYKVVACLENRADVQLIEAAALGDSVQVRTLIIEQSADPHATDPAGDTAIHMAARSGDAETCRILLHEAGLDSLTFLASKNRTPIHFAAEAPHSAAALRFLLEAGADVSATANDNWTPLHAAAQAGNPDSILLLCNAGVNVNALSDAGVSPLIAAATFGHYEACRILLKHNADTTHTVRNKSAADWAEHKGYNQLAAFLKEKEENHTHEKASTKSTLTTTANNV